MKPASSKTCTAPTWTSPQVISNPGVVTIENAPGSLVLFQGRYSLHRVKPIHGERSRWLALLGYDTKPGVMSSDHLRMMRYGRVK